MLLKHWEDLPEIMRICRAYGIRAYMTLNITLYGEDLQAAYETLDAAKAAGAHVIGVIPPRIKAAGRLADNCDFLIEVNNMSERKQRMRDWE